MAKVTVPQLGESVAEGTIGKWLKQPATTSTYEPLLESYRQVNADNRRRSRASARSPSRGRLPQRGRDQIIDTGDWALPAATAEAATSAPAARPVAQSAGPERARNRAVAASAPVPLRPPARPRPAAATPLGRSTPPRPATPTPADPGCPTVPARESAPPRQVRGNVAVRPDHRDTSCRGRDQLDRRRQNRRRTAGRRPPRRPSRPQVALPGGDRLPPGTQYPAPDDPDARHRGADDRGARSRTRRPHEVDSGLSGRRGGQARVPGREGASATSRSGSRRA